VITFAPTDLEEGATNPQIEVTAEAFEEVSASMFYLDFESETLYPDLVYLVREGEAD